MNNPENPPQGTSKFDLNSIDLDKLDIIELQELESKIKEHRKQKSKLNAHKLLIETLGDKYEDFIKNEYIDLIGNNNKQYRLHITGYIECFDTKVTNKIQYDGQLYRSGYPASDILVTAIYYIKYNTSKLETLWGCGNISVKGGEIE